jgi:hypothetical protein
MLFVASGTTLPTSSTISAFIKTSLFILNMESVLIRLRRKPAGAPTECKVSAANNFPFS